MYRLWLWVWVGDKPDETVTVSGSTSVTNFPVTGALLEITDDNAAPTVTLSLSQTTISETDDSATTNVAENKTIVTAALNHTSSVATTVTISVDPDTRGVTLSVTGARVPIPWCWIPSRRLR